MRRFRQSLLLLAILCLAHFAWGQGTTTGSILGTVTDTTGAVIADAPIDVTNTATGVVTALKTTGTGDYTAANLIPGVYKVSVQMPGFSRAVVTGVVLAVAQSVRVNLQLKPGAANETVTVTSTAVALDTDSSAISQTVTPQQMSELPLNGRNFTDLLFVGAGAVQAIGEQGQMRKSEGNAISIAGSRPESNNYTLDGLTNTDTALSTPAVILSQDAIQEFKVQSETYSAQYGFGANQVNIISKSGGNQIHASIFEFNRNDAYDAIKHQTVLNTSNKATELRQNQFGYVLSGPAVIPHVYNGRDKTFWMANYEGWRTVQGGHIQGYAPTAAELGGDFSALDSLPTYDPSIPYTTKGSCTYMIFEGHQCRPIDPATGNPITTLSSTKFARLPSVTSKIVPNGSADTLTADSNGVPVTGAINWSSVANTVTDTDQQTYRGDQNFGKWGSVFFRYTKADYSSKGLATDSVALDAGANVFTENSSSWTAAYTLPLPKGFINDFRFGRLRAQSIQGDSPASAADVTAMGITNTFSNLPDYARGYPNLGWGESNGVSAGSPGNNPTTSDIPVWEFADSVIKQHGAHTFTFGFDYRTWTQKRNLATNFLGSFGFSSSLIENNGQSGSCATKYCGTGNAWADYLLGYFSSASAFQPGPFSSASSASPGHLNQYQFKWLGPYFQDDWKATPKLTLNLGLRWDYQPTVTAVNNVLFWLDPENTQGGLCFAYKALETDGIAPDGNGFYRYCGDNPKKASKKPFAPRFGFAYRPLDKFVVRGGYGVFFDATETREMDNSGDQYPFLIRTSVTPYASSLKSTNGLFTSMSALKAVSAANNGGAFTAVILSENPMSPYVQQWTLSVQRELPNSTTLEANYVGTKGTHLLERFNVDQAGALPADDVDACNANPADTTHNCPYTMRLPLPNFTSSNGFLDSKWIGHSSYNAGNVKLEHRASDGAVLLAYTWAKSMDSKSAAAGMGSTNSYAGPMDSANPQTDYARSDFDVGQRFVASYAYMLPFGRGKKFAGTVNHATDLAIGGWELTGIATFQQGFPFSILASDLDGLLMSATQRAAISGSATSGFSKSTKEWFNTAAFSQPQAGVFGNSGRNMLREPGISNWDMGAVKYFNLSERFKFQLRVESFNTFNHTQWGADPKDPDIQASGPGTHAVNPTVGSAYFGQVQYARLPREIQFGGKLTF